AAAAGLSGTQLCRKHLAIPAPDLSLKPRLRELHGHPRCLSGCVAQAPCRGRTHHAHRRARLGGHRSMIRKAGITPMKARIPFDDRKIARTFAVVTYASSLL